MDGAWHREAASFLRVLHSLCKNDSLSSSLCSLWLQGSHFYDSDGQSKKEQDRREWHRAVWKLQSIVLPGSPDCPDAFSSISMAWVSTHYACLIDNLVRFLPFCRPVKTPASS